MSVLVNFRDFIKQYTDPLLAMNRSIFRQHGALYMDNIHVCIGQFTSPLSAVYRSYLAIDGPVFQMYMGYNSGDKRVRIG